MPMEKTLSLEAVLAEFAAMTAFVFIGPGSAVGVACSAGWVQQVALTFGLAITVLAYTFGHRSGGHINPAVTFGLVVAGKCNVLQGIANIFAQILGAFCGAGILAITYDHPQDRTGNLASNVLQAGVHQGSAFMGEVFMTGLLMLVVLETAVNPQSSDNRILAPIAIGFAVYLAHSVLIPIDGCSINPARSFGPAIWTSMMRRDGVNGPDLYAIWRDHWIFWIAPLVGAGVVAGVSRLTPSIAIRLGSSKGEKDASVA